MAESKVTISEMLPTHMNRPTVLRTVLLCLSNDSWRIQAVSNDVTGPHSNLVQREFFQRCQLHCGCRWLDPLYIVSTKVTLISNHLKGHGIFDKITVPRLLWRSLEEMPEIEDVSIVDLFFIKMAAFARKRGSYPF